MPTNKELIFVAGIIVSIVGTLVGAVGVLARYVWNRHCRDNDRAEETNERDHTDLFKRIGDLERSKKK